VNWIYLLHHFLSDDEVKGGKGVMSSIRCTVLSWWTLEAAWTFEKVWIADVIMLRNNCMKLQDKFQQKCPFLFQ
jgi:hypothetical protein